MYNNRFTLVSTKMVSDIIKNAEIGKRITFNDELSYFYIPARDEIIKEGLKKDMWWSQEEMFQFRVTSNIEVQQFMQAFPYNDIRTVQKQLWLIVDFDEIYKRIEQLQKH